MKSWILILFLLTNRIDLFAQLPSFQHNYSREDTVNNKVFNHFSENYDFVISQNVSSYWWSGRDYYQILTHSDSGWSAWLYKNFEVKKKNGSKKLININNAKIVPGQFRKIKSFTNDNAVKYLFDSLKLFNFFSLQNDSLNADRGLPVFDLAYYRFDIITKKKSRVISSYAPDFYFKQFPDMTDRRNFIFSRNCFDRWWNLYCY
ncbi:MAG: hypothetical protein ABI091_06430 [Ferruginibacter sp.]